MKSDEDKVYMKIVELEEIYNFVVHLFFYLNISLDQDHWNNVQIYIKSIDFIIFMWGLKVISTWELKVILYRVFIIIGNVFVIFGRCYNILKILIVFW
jgi:hypothetical protein